MSARSQALLYAVLALLVGGLAYLLGVGSLLGQRAEESVLDASAFTTDPPAPLSLVSIGSVVVALLILGALAWWLHGIRRAMMVLICSGTAILASQALKESWLERPQLLELDASNTFPSGHMTVFAVFAGGLIWALPRRVRVLTGIMSAFMLAIVSWQLLEYGWHRPSDLIGAQALALFCFAVGAWIGPRTSRKTTAGSAPRLADRIGLVGLTILGIVLVIGGVALVGIAATAGSSELMLNAGEVSLVGVSVLTASLLAKLAP